MNSTSATDRGASAETAHSRLALAAAVSDRSVLEYCLLRSPDLVEGAVNLRTYEGFKTAGLAYNAALDDANTDYLVLVHQDVYLPENSAAALIRMLDDLTVKDPSWAVCGVIGMDASGTVVGQTWSTSNGGLIGPPVDRPVLVETLDEMVLIVRTASGLRFDPDLPLFHMYAADIIQIAKAAGMNSYVIPFLAIHFERVVVKLGADYKAAYRYFQKKWRAKLPIPNLICPIVANPWRVIWADIRVRRYRGFAKTRPAPQGDPVEFARSVRQGR